MLPRTLRDVSLQTDGQTKTFEAIVGLFNPLPDTLCWSHFAGENLELRTKVQHLVIKRRAGKRQPVLGANRRSG